MFLLAVILIIIGAVNALFPEVGWHLSEGWKFKDAEPSETALLVSRIGGVITIIIGVVLLFQ